MPIYAIKDWDRHYETSQSRRCESLAWVAVPNKHDGLSYRRLMRLPNALSIYGAFVLIVQVASKCRPRGILALDGVPLTAVDIALKTGASESQIDEAIAVLSSETIGWITTVADCRPVNDPPAEQISDPARSPLGVDSEQARRPIKNLHDTLPDRTGPDRTIPDRTGKSGRSVGGGWKRPGIKTLRDTGLLMDWLRIEGVKAGVPAETPDARVRLLAFAERAIEYGRDPPRIFASYVLRDIVAGDDSKLERKHLDAAQRRYAAWEAISGPG